MAKTKQIFTTPEARMVKGHAMERRAVTDNKTGQPKLDNLGKPRTSVYFAAAIPKGSEKEWKSTPWGAILHGVGVAGWPNGEWESPTFSWKVTDGDSRVPNKKGKKPCDQEGFPGHWIIQCSTELPVKCFHAGKYDPTEQIQDANTFKRGDYIRVRIETTDNSPSESPGIYINPLLVEFRRAGELIVGDGPDAAEAFGDEETKYGTNTAAPAPSGAKSTVPGCAYTYQDLIEAGWDEAQMIAEGYYKPAAPAPAPKPKAPAPAPKAPAPAPKAPVAPARDLVPAAPPKKQTLEGCPYTYEELVASGWSDAQMVAEGYLGDDIPF